MPFACEAGRLVLTGRPMMAEVTLIAALRNLGLGLAAMADQPLFAKLSAVVSLFLTTVATSIGGEAGMAVLAPVAGFAVTGTFWLMLLYWKRLNIPAAVRSTGGGTSFRAQPGCWESSPRLRRWRPSGHPGRPRP